MIQNIKYAMRALSPFVAVLVFFLLSLGVLIAGKYELASIFFRATPFFSIVLMLIFLVGLFSFFDKALYSCFNAISPEKCGEIDAKENSKTGLMEFLATIAPMLGFAGTLVGLIKSFDIFHAGGDFKSVFGGLSVSMTTSLMGIWISLILLVAVWLVDAWTKTDTKSVANDSLVENDAE